MDPVERLSAALADRYAIEREVGAGGMATVYLAHDVRHDRKVALKVLRPELSAILGAERFLAEIKTTANLQHPHILPLHDSGEADGMVYYVMPYVEGESLRDRLTHETQLPVEDAVRIAREVADALHYAHTQGVVHRDIKPENILLHGGHAMVSDFGIALAASRSGGATRMTETGMSLGTPAYMSPEQAMGEREITPRADVYALGCVLYEMLSGEPPFVGPTAQAIIARVMTEEPRALTLHRHTIPPHVEAAVRQALEKLPADRFTTAAQFAEALGKPAFTGWGTGTLLRRAGPPSVAQRSRLRDPVFLGLGVVAVAALVLAAALLRRAPAAAPLRPVRFTLAGTDSAPIIPDTPWPAAISPDGGMLVYAVGRPGGGTTLYARPTDQLEGHPIPGTAVGPHPGGLQPLFSPDGRWLAFEADGKEKKVRLDGSAPVTIAEGGYNNGADWTSTDELVVGATSGAHGLSHVSIAGGVLTEFTRPDTAHGELDHSWPIATPDGRSVFFAIWTGSLATARLAVASLPSGTTTRLDVLGIRPLAVLDGYLVYVQADGAVMAVRLNGAMRQTIGQPFPVLDPVRVSPELNGNSGVFVSRGGALVSELVTHSTRLVWLGRDGIAHPISPDIRDFGAPRLSPDGRRIAVIVSNGSKGDVWILDLETGTLSRLTTAETVTSAEWTRDGTHVVYSARGRGSRAAIWSQAVGMAAAPEQLVEVPYLATAVDIAPDQRSLLVATFVDQRLAVQRVPLDSGRVLRPFSDSTTNDIAPRFSPDGHWVALVSFESGRPEVYVRSFPVPTVKVQVSAGGGGEPAWGADGTRLYYRSGDRIVEARLATTPTLHVLARDTVFGNLRSVGGSGFGANYDVSRDGSRLVVLVGQSETYKLVVVPNWLSEFRQRLTARRN